MRYHTGRQRVIACNGAFHGRTFGAMSLGGSKAIHQRGFGPLVPGVHRIPFNCDQSVLEEQFRTVCAPDEVAAIFVEPIQGEGGYRLPEPDFLPMLRRVCDAHGILLVADEVQSGMGRTGKMFAIEHFGVTPDVICLAKGLASGMPLGAIVANADLMNWPSGSHASTFGGNPVCCRAALATIDLLEREFMANATHRGQQLLAGLHRLADREPTLAQPRGLGLMVAVDVLKDDHLDPQRRDAIVEAAFHRGLLLLGCGKAAVRFCPGLCVTAEQIESALEILAAACVNAHEV